MFKSRAEKVLSGEVSLLVMAAVPDMLLEQRRSSAPSPQIVSLPTAPLLHSKPLFTGEWTSVVGLSSSYYQRPGVTDKEVTGQNG